MVGVGQSHSVIRPVDLAVMNKDEERSASIRVPTMAEAVPIVWALAEVTESEECVLQILKHLKMEHLSQCASACRLWSLLAFETQQRIPSWSSRMSFLPHVVGVLDPERVSEQIRKTVRDARSQLVGPPDLCFVFVGSMVAPCYLEALAQEHYCSSSIPWIAIPTTTTTTIKHADLVWPFISLFEPRAGGKLKRQRRF